VELDLTRFREMTLDDREFTDLISKEAVTWKDKLILDKRGAIILSSK
jgi:hypothetical protein